MGLALVVTKKRVLEKLAEQSVQQNEPFGYVDKMYQRALNGEATWLNCRVIMVDHSQPITTERR